MNILDVLSNTTLAAISTDVQAAMVLNAQQYAEEEFLAGRIGEAYLGLQNYPDIGAESLNCWYQKPNVGNTPPIKPKPHGTYTWTPGPSGLFTFAAAPTNEDNFYRFMMVKQPAKFYTSARDTREYVLLNLPGWQGMEWQFQLQGWGVKITAAYQLSTSSGVRVWDMTLNNWKKINVPLPDLSQPVVADCKYSMNAKELTHETITLNGKEYEVGNVQPTVASAATKFTICDQVDPKVGGIGSFKANDISVRLA